MTEPKVIPPEVFNQVKIAEKPQITTLDDLQDAYIDLFEIYKNNLHILKLIQNLEYNLKPRKSHSSSLILNNFQKRGN